MMNAARMVFCAWALLYSVAASGQGVRVFKDWVVACNNLRQCEASSLVEPVDRLEAGVNEYRAILKLFRGAAAADPPAIRFSLPPDQELASELIGKPISLHAGGRQMNLAALTAKQQQDAEISIPRSRVDQLIRMIRKPVQLVLQIGNQAFPVSLRGSYASMLYMDEKQQRLNTSSALVRGGVNPMKADLPQVPQVKLVGPLRQRQVPNGLLDKLMPRAQAICEQLPSSDFNGWAHVLDDQRFLVGIPCWLAAYNYASVLFVVPIDSKGAEMEQASIAKLASPGRKGEFLEAAEVSGAMFDSKSGVLTSYYKARGLGDCGTYIEWAWTGKHFDLLSYNEMPVCRGLLEPLNVYRAELVN